MLTRMICFFLGLFISDKDLKTEGFELESCRSMIALMDVSFASDRGLLDTTLVHLSFTFPHHMQQIIFESNAT